MTRNNVLSSVSISALIALLTACGKPAPTPLSYQENIKPILDTHCVSCHVPGGAGYDKLGLRLDSYEGVMKGSRLNPVVVPGSSIGSVLYRLVSGQLDPSISMPHGQATLSQSDIKTIATWIDQGAPN